MSRSATRNKVGRDPKYLRWIREQPCMICQQNGMMQLWNTEAAHVGDRGLSQKCPDRQAIPLCAHHHRTSDGSHHALGKEFWRHWGIVKRNAIKEYNRMYNSQKYGDSMSEKNEKPSRIIEVARSFSFKLNVGNYESRDFFCSQKAECTEETAEEVSGKLYAFCKSEVLKSVAEAKREKL